MPILSVRGLSKSFARGLARGSRRTFAISDVDLALSRGEVVALFGPESSGKTTLLQCVAGILRPDAGDVLLRGETLPASRCSHIGYVPAVPVFYPFLTSRDVLSFQSARMNRPISDHQVENILDIVELTDLAHYPLARFGREELKRVAIAESRCSHPDVMLIDKSVNDRISERCLARLAASGIATLIAVRDCSLVASVATRLIHIECGRVDRTFTPDEQMMFVAERLH
jgi:ABC-type multidrug transport system ATPase subunit